VNPLFRTLPSRKKLVSEFALVSALALIFASSSATVYASTSDAHAQSAPASATLTTLFNSASETGFTQFSNMPPIQGADGLVYGVMTTGGSSSLGSIYSVDSTGTVKTVVDFATTNLQHPGSLLLNTDGTFYGTALNGTLDGVLFKLDPVAGTVTTLYTFADSIVPMGPLTIGPNGLLYGTALLPSNGGSMIFSFYPELNTVTTVYSFAKGILASAGVQFSAGTAFYGIASDSACGQIFKVTQTGVYTNVHEFSCLLEGAVNPQSGLLLAPDGNFYGVLNASLVLNGGLFKYVPATGAVSIEHSFSILTDGIGPSPLTIGGDGNIYGFTQLDALNLSGEAFVYDVATGVYKDLAAIPSGLVGAAGGIEGIDGNIYVTSGGLSISALGQSNVLKLALPVALPATVSLSAPSSSGLVNSTITLSGGVSSLLAPLAPACNAVGALASAVTGPLSGVINATITLPGTAGTYNYGVVCPGAGSTGISITVLPLPATTTSMSASVTSVLPGQSVTFTTTVASSGSDTVPTGTVTFYANSTKIGTVTLVDGTATLVWTSEGSLAPGTYNITADYSGDSTHAASTSKAASFTVRGPITTATSVSAPATVVKPANVTFNVTISEPGDTYTNDPAPTGTVKFTVGTGTLAVVNVVNGTATLTVSSAYPNPGTYPIVATYSGDMDHTSSSKTFDIKVESSSDLVSATAITTPSSVPQGSTSTFTVTVTGNSGAPTGTANIVVAASAADNPYLVLDTVKLNAGQGSWTFKAPANLKPGTYYVYATYPGDSTYGSSKSTNHVVIVPQP
jgi:uncharacterized repeat protein (TIGR03803 family)